MNNAKIGFWPLFSIVIGSQIGSGVFMLPAVLAPYGAFSLLGWVISGCGAIALALVFATLASSHPKTGGPHIYVERAFGKHLAFFIGWGYWIVSWVSTAAVLSASVGYLTPFLPSNSTTLYIGLEIFLLCFIIFLNLKGIGTAGKAEVVLTTFKFIPLVLLPIFALQFWSSSNFSLAPEVSALGTGNILGKVAMMTMWGFVGVESGLASAGSVVNPQRTIPRAIVFGTITVAAIYAINSTSIMGLMPREVLSESNAPYTDAAKLLFGGNWNLLISVIASMVCIGTLNAWVLTSSQIMLGLAESKFVPQFFARKNASHAPIVAVLASSLGLIPILILTASTSLAKQVGTVIDISVIVFIIVYLVCGLAYLKLALQKHYELKVYSWISTFIAISFCGWVLYSSALTDLYIALAFIFSGLPFYIWWALRKA